MNLEGRGILITGGSLGIGKAVAGACVSAGADVVISARGQADLDAAAAELGEQSGGRRVLAKQADVADRQSVVELVRFAESELPDFCCVVNAAAVNGPKGRFWETDIDEWLATIHINLVGTVLVCREAVPLFLAKGYGKIVNFSGGGATSPYPRFTAYGSSKAAVVRFTETIAQELKDTRVFVNAVAPGAVNTRMLEEVLQAGPERVGPAAYTQAEKQKQEGGAPPELAAELTAYLLCAETDGLAGRLLSAVWDPWRTIAQHIREIMSGDIYTLRRIVPEDRGKDWK